MGETGSVSSKASGGAAAGGARTGAGARGAESAKAPAGKVSTEKKAATPTRGELGDAVRISPEVKEKPEAVGFLSALSDNFADKKPASEVESPAVESLREHIGERTKDLKGVLPGGFSAAGGLDKNCADTVTSALKAAGTFDQNIVGVKAMERAFIEKGIEQIPASEAMPGDVWVSNSRRHTELVSEPGGEMTIGSNNLVSADGKYLPVQAISERPKDPDSGVYYDLTP